MKFILILLFTPALFISVGCKQTTSSGPLTGSGDIYPLKVGNSWTYQTKRFNSDGSINSDTTGTMSITGTEIFQGHQAYDILFSGETSPSVLFFHEAPDYFSVSLHSSDQPIQLFLKDPMTIGEVITLSDTSFLGAARYKETLKFIGSGEIITTAAGTFSCLHYEKINYSGTPQYLSIDDLQEDYYAKGVGLVLARDSVSIGVAPYLNSTFELVAYH